MTPNVELTQRQQDIIDFIARTVNERGYPPSVREIGEAIGVDSIDYLSLNGLLRAINLPRHRFCTACLTGVYPQPVQIELERNTLARAGALR